MEDCCSVIRLYFLCDKPICFRILTVFWRWVCVLVYLLLLFQLYIMFCSLLRVINDYNNDLVRYIFCNLHIPYIFGIKLVICVYITAAYTYYLVWRPCLEVQERLWQRNASLRLWNANKRWWNDVEARSSWNLNSCWIFTALFARLCAVKPKFHFFDFMRRLLVACRALFLVDLTQHDSLRLYFFVFVWLTPVSLTKSLHLM